MEYLDIFLSKTYRKHEKHEIVVKNLVGIRNDCHDVWDCHDNVFCVGVLNEFGEMYLRAIFANVDPVMTLNGLSPLKFVINRCTAHKYKIKGCDFISSDTDISVKDMKFINIDDYELSCSYVNNPRYIDNGLEYEYVDTVRERSS